MDDLSNGNLFNLSHLTLESRENFIFRKMDLIDYLKTKSLKGIDVVVHMAAWGSVPRSFEDPDSYMANNVLATNLLLEKARLDGVPKVIMASSSSVYGNKKYRHEEDTELIPESPYASTKLINEKTADFYRMAYGLDVECLRFFNVIGPRQNSKGSYSAVIPKFCKDASEGKPLSINSVDLEDCPARDFTSVYLVAEVISRLLYMSSSERAFNVCTGNMVSIYRVAELVNDIYENKAGIKFTGPRKSDVIAAFGSNFTMQNLLGDFYKETDLINPDKQVVNTIKWFKRFGHGQ